MVDHTSDILNFELETLTVTVGSTISWTNRDRAPHTVTAGTSPKSSGEFESGMFGKDKEFSFTFDAPGTFPYFCSIHPFMTGVITVVPAN